MKNRAHRSPKIRPPNPTTVEAPWRLFIAIPLPADIRAEITNAIEFLSQESWPIRWIAPETAHLTLHFLGDTDPERAELLRLALAEPIVRHTAFELTLNDPGVFPNMQRPRVLWLGLGGQTKQLELLQQSIGETLRQLDFPVEPGKFHPHITLGRVRDQHDSDFVVALPHRLDQLAQARNRNQITLPVNQVRLIRSFLRNDGARHESLAEYLLA